ncbi:reprolysin-like metallopeptidase [Aquimarina sp. 2201CG5-10]|uniref:reprolysin-like metallopeptidase n=1 Tax=Aquimarina callyspongiae TaxID=3098150 RepID=UPI002AB5212F|nr:zinc-dependent metalloprotease family protein [Aquimarina sp. 2201CG5-10]MDY8138148.1 zinc-dependent metalloprotease family protein [Aquimarina sp. 2201CG5-10]
MNKNTLYVCVSLFFLTMFHFSMSAQDIWWEKSNERYSKNQVNIDGTYLTFDINNRELENKLEQVPFRLHKKNQKHIIKFPGENNGFRDFVISRTEVMHPYLAVKYSEIKTFVGYALKDPTEVIRFSYYPKVGIQGSIIKPGENTIVIKPINQNTHILYDSKEEVSSLFDCQTEEISAKIQDQQVLNGRNANDGNLRRYRLALSVSGDYSQFFLDGTESDDTERKAKVMAAMVASINRVNGIFERDFGVTMQIIPENDSLIFLDPTSDPYTTGSSLNSQLQNTLDDDPNVGTDRYDVGHLFHEENAIYGNAGCIACVCTDGSKGSGYTTHRDPSSDHFNLIVAHEFGHQFGGYHVQSSSNCRSGFNSEVEPGSGSSIMGYAGICSPNVQSTPDDYFNYVDIRDVAIWTINNSNCAEIIPTGNTAPVADAGNDYTIPQSTPFVLEGEANDIDGVGSLTYCWEQNNPENPNSSSTPQSHWINGPLFRSKLPTASNKRYFPQLDDVLAGNLTPTWEVLPSVARSMRFEFTVRDNTPQGGQTNTDGVLLTVDANSGPFAITSQNTIETWNVGEQVTVNWDVANTDQAPVNANMVDILLSVDGGYTYPYILQDDIANDGSETFVLPNVEGSTTARIMIKASDNIFFAINSTNFTIQTSEFIMSISDNSESVCQLTNAVYDFEYRTFLDFNEEVIFTTENLPVGVQATFSPSSVTGAQLSGTPVELTVSGTENLSVGTYSFSIKGNANSGIEKIVNLDLEIFGNSITPSTLVSPSDNQIGFSLGSPFEWSEDVNAESYEIQIATDNSFTNIVESTVVSENNYVAQSLSYNTAYFWRVQNTNPCGTGNFSAVHTFSTQCSNPENFGSIAAGPSYVGLQWLDNNSTNWEIEYGFSGFVLGNGTVVSAATNPYEVNNLNSFTSYDFYLRSTCTVGGNGVWIGPVSVKTTENFCAGDHFYDTGGPDGNYSNGENVTTVISPDTTDDRVRVNFESFSLESCCDRLTIYDGPDNSSTVIGQYSGNSPGQIVSTHPSGALTFVFTSDGSVTSTGWDATVVCEPKPNCLIPNNVQITDILQNEARLIWDAGGTDSNWEIEYGLNGFNQGSGITETASTNSYTLQNLSSDTLYDAYIKTICDAGGFSDSIGPITFRTQISCPAPSGFVINTVTSNTADLAWDITQGSQGSWELEYGSSGFVQGNGDLIQSNINSITLSELTSATLYDVYIRVNCDNNDVSAWAGPFNFRTSCEIVSENPNEYIHNGSFECGNLEPWRSTGPGGGSGCRMNFTVLENSSNVCVIVPDVDPSDGIYAAFTSFDGNAGDTYVLEQTISLPSDISQSVSAIVSFDLRIEYSVTFGTPTAERTLEVDIYDTSNNLIATVGQQSFGIDPRSGSINSSISRDVLEDIINLGGEDVILRFTASIPDTSTGPAKALIDNVSFFVEKPLSVEEELFDNEFSIAPNPNDGSFMLTYEGQKKLNEVLIYDLSGKLIFVKDLSNFDKREEIKINQVETGMYLIKIISDQTVVTKRIIVK